LRRRIKRRIIYIAKPILWLATTIAVALTGTAALGDDGLMWQTLWSRRPRTGGIACDCIPGLSSIRSGRERSGEGTVVARLLGVGLTERGSLSALEDTWLWSPTARERVLGSTEFKIDLSEVARAVHRRFWWGTTLVRVERSDGSYVTLRGRDPVLAEIFEPVARSTRPRE